MRFYRVRPYYGVTLKITILLNALVSFLRPVAALRLHERRRTKLTFYSLSPSYSKYNPANGGSGISITGLGLSDDNLLFNIGSELFL